MFQASKRLQAIRRQLKDMEEQYRQHSDNVPDEQGEDTTALVLNLVEENAKFSKIQTTKEIPSFSADFSVDQEALTTLSEDAISSRLFQKDLMNEDALFTETEVSYQKSQLPLSEELKCAIASNIEDLDNVDDLIGDVLCSMTADPSPEGDLHSFEQNFTQKWEKESIREGASGLDNIHLQRLDDNSNNACLTPKDEQKRLKDRQKKDNHNKIERRRRYNINDRIKDLANLLPASTHSAMKLNKGSILTATVEFVKALLKDKSRLRQLEAKQKWIESEYQNMRIKVFQMELKMKLKDLSEEMDQSKSKQERPSKSSLQDIDNLIQSILENSIPAKSKGKRTAKVETKITEQKREIRANKGLRNLLTSPYRKTNSGSDNQKSQTLVRSDKQNAVKRNTLIQNSQRNMMDSYKTTTQTLRQNNECSQSKIITVEQDNPILDIFNAEDVTDIIIIPSDQEGSKPDQFRSPISPTTSMLENLLRNSRLNSLSDSSGIESSMESSNDLL